MEPAAHTIALTRAEALRRQGFSESAEVEDVVEAVAAFCGAPVELALREVEPELAEALVLEGAPADPWVLVRSGVLGRRIRDAGGADWGLLCLSCPIAAQVRDGVDHSARLLEGMVARAQARRERRGPSRGPAGASFVPGLVHELRNAAFGFSAILDAFQARYEDREEAMRYGGALRRNLERLTGFIEELGAYGDPGMGPMEPVALDVVLRDAVAACQPQALRLEVALALEWRGPSVRVKADARSLGEAFSSLVRWALGQGGSRAVTLNAGGAQGGAKGHVEGPGLPLANADPARIFEPFYFKASGMGRLALPVARRIIEAHCGTLVAGPGPCGEIRIAFTLPGL